MENATQINGLSFYSCGNITISELPSGVTSIGTEAFMYCSKLALKELPSGITSIGTNAFGSCRNITITELPISLTKIEDQAFWGCTKIASLKYNGVVYTSRSALTAALTNNGVTVGKEVFSGTALSD